MKEEKPYFSVDVVMWMAVGKRSARFSLVTDLIRFRGITNWKWEPGTVIITSLKWNLPQRWKFLSGNKEAKSHCYVLLGAPNRLNGPLIHRAQLMKLVVVKVTHMHTLPK